MKKWYFILIATVVLNIVWFLRKTDVVIGSGVRLWNTVAYILAATLIASIGIVAVMLIHDAKKKKIEKRNEEAQVSEKKTASLSMKGQLSTETIVGLLTDTINGKNGDWSKLKLQLMECREQLYKMDRYQEKLHGLLLENDAQKLENTEAVVSRVEQYMLQNTRKICNYVQIYDSSDDDGFAKTSTLVETCLKDNKQQLEHVQDLLSAIADFLNSQGQDATALDTMEIYKKTIIKSIEQN